MNLQGHLDFANVFNPPITNRYLSEKHDFRIQRILSVFTSFLMQKSTIRNNE